MSKRCTKCEIEKSFSEFGDNMYHGDRKQSRCQECENERKSKWKIDNRERYLENRRRYERERKAIDINFRLTKNLRGRLRKALLKQVASKNDTTEALLGISYSEFKNYIEFLMTPNMNWDNIHLDHVRPLSSFDLKDIEQLKEASHYTNIQPLLAKDNLLKGDRYHEYDIWLQSENVYDYAYFSTIK